MPQESVLKPISYVFMAEILDMMAVALAHFVHNGVQII